MEKLRRKTQNKDDQKAQANATFKLAVMLKMPSGKR